MRNNLIRTTALAATVLAGLLSLSACGKGGTDTAAAPASSSPSASGSANPGQKTDGGGTGGGAKASGSRGDSAEAGSRNSSGGKASAGSGHANRGNASADGDSGDGGKSRYGQVCGANDLSWSTASKTQAGGYIQISVQAKPGITCTLPGTHPVVAFGSDGTQAGPAEQAATEQVKLSGGTTAYAGVNPKTINGHHGKEFAKIIVAVEEGDGAGPISLPIDSATIDGPIVTNWHTSAQKAVPGSGLDSD
ncbi:DUF4232 domain-containing protein [Streptomyces sp. NPDC001667]